jgi:diguanylate cyclase
MNTLNQFFIGHLYTQENNQLLEAYQTLIVTSVPDCVAAFYEILLTDSATKRFLNNQQVEQHLRKELGIWLNETLSPKVSEPECLALIAKQRHVGEVHARVNVPMLLVNSAMSIVKKVLFADVRLSNVLSAEIKTDLIILLNQLLDASLSLINESYLEGLVENERSAQEYRSRSTAQEIAIEIERVKGALYGWMTQFMTDLLTGSNERVVDIHHQEFSLWIRHRLNFVCADNRAVGTIKENLNQLQMELDALHDAPDEARDERIKRITGLTNECGWLLGEIADRNLENATREDPLTSLIERRFLAPIIQNEALLAQKTKTPFSVMMLDVDNFKSVNDIYGHQAGDSVLSIVGRTLKRSLRVTDYAFRYGGEEFLILMPETELSSAVRAAEKLMDKIRATEVRIDNGRLLKVTVSIGLAEYDGHPDFEHMLKHADEKLYEAKHAGKDRCAF